VFLPLSLRFSPENRERHAENLALSMHTERARQRARENLAIHLHKLKRIVNDIGSIDENRDQAPQNPTKQSGLLWIGDALD